MLPNRDTNLQLMSAALRDFPWADRRAYGMFLAQTYYYVLHSTKLLLVAAGRMKQEDQEYYKRFLAHMKEESGHEVIALRDLRKLGFDIKEFPELPEARMFWETQYYKIEHLDPLSILGYIYALEALASQDCPWIKKELEKNYPPECHTFIRIHGEDDPEHVEKARSQIASLPEERQRWVDENFEQTAVAYTQLVRKIAAEGKKGNLLKAA